MDVYEAIARRRSVGKYKPDAVAEETLARVLDAGRLAPSGHNRQPWRVVVREEGRRRAVAAFTKVGAKHGILGLKKDRIIAKFGM